MMTPVLVYFLKSAISLAMFYGFYWFFLRKETFFRFNRYYFIGSMFSSLLLPFIDVSGLLTANEAAPVRTITESYVTFQNAVISPVIYSAPVKELQSPAFSASDYLLMLYTAGVVLLLLRLFLQVVVLTFRIKSTEAIDIDGLKVITHKKVKSPFSFFSYVFINPEQLDEENIGDVILHEKEHIEQRHSIDLLFAEFLTILQWPNPFAWLTKRSLIETHEYLADSAVLKKGVPVDEYQRTLISFMLGAGNPALITPFNFSLNKKRLIMMKKIKSPSIRKWRSLLLLPLLAILIAAFSEPDMKNSSGNENIISKHVKPTAGNDNLIKVANHAEEGKYREKETISDKSQSDKILVLLDGEKISEKELRNIPPATVKSMIILKGKKAVEKYGADAGKGVVNVTLKDDCKGLKELDLTKPVPMLFAIDGKLVDEKTFQEVIKLGGYTLRDIAGDEAVRKYGEKARFGVREGIKKEENSEDTFSDSVVDKESGNPVSGLSVINADKNTITITNTEGLLMMKAGKVTTDATSSGNNNAKVTVPFKSGDDVEVKMIKTDDSGIMRQGVKDGNGLVVFLNGNEISLQEMKKIPPENILKVNVLKGEKAESLGGNAKDGVILITTKDAGEYILKGKVIDAETEKPIRGVSVIVQGTTTGSITGEDGTFELSVPEPQAMISFSFVGYGTIITKMSAGESPVIKLKKTITVISFDNLPEKTAAPVQPDKASAGDKPVFFVVEAMPEFPGGITALHDYIVSNTKYPTKAKRQKISGTVYVNFTVDENGKVTDVYVDKDKSIDPLLDKEAVRVVSGMPDWKPGAQRNHPVPVQMSVPVKFEL
ncbi:MAG: TonB family protein [Chlorobi bacterium]|nr:TonB family protein [Chlorobiota bacterium]